MVSSGLFALLTLAAIHMFANRPNVLGWVWHGRFLSFASGVSLSYVLIDLLPALEKGRYVLNRTFEPLIPYLDRHTYLIALIGILFYYGIEGRTSLKRYQWISISGYFLFNFLIGATLADSSNPEIQPLILFTIAIGLHYFIRDHLTQIAGKRRAVGLLVLCLFMGYFVGLMTKIPNAVVAIAISFVAGGMILNIFRYELPKKEKGGYFWFVFGACVYTAVLLGLK